MFVDNNKLLTIPVSFTTFFFHFLKRERKRKKEREREKAEKETKITGNLTKHENCTPGKYTYYFEGLCLCVSRVRESTGGKVNE